MTVTHISKHTGREYLVDERGIAHRVHEDDMAWEQAEAEAEMRAEFAMSWVCGGGRAEDASAAYAMYHEVV